MYSKFDQISLVGMSNSELFLAEKDHRREVEFKFILRPNVEFRDGCRIAASKDLDELHQHESDYDVEEGKKIISSEDLIIKMPLLGEFKVEDDDDGFRTPTSMDHKIPLIPQCPPAPRKPKSRPLMKRKASSKHCLLRIDISKEIESLFPPSLLSELGHKIKKVRGEDTK